jgi:hypothetical protein
VLIGNPLVFGVGYVSGDRGKHDVPGKRGFLSAKVGAFSFNIVSNSAKIQPIDQISIGSP